MGFVDFFNMRINIYNMEIKSNEFSIAFRNMIHVKGFNSRYLVKGNNVNTLVFFNEKGESFKIVLEDSKFVI